MTSDMEDLTPFNDIVPSEYERQMYSSKALEPMSYSDSGSLTEHRESYIQDGNESWIHVEHQHLRSASQDDGFLSFWSSASYDSAIDYYAEESDYISGSYSTIKSMLAELMQNTTCVDVGEDGSVMCCTVSIDNETTSTICSNETDVTIPEDNKLTAKNLCPQRKWESLLKLICIPTVCVFGLCGNTISFLVMCSGAYRRKSYGHYLRALAVFDNLTLIINLVFTVNDVIILNDTTGNNSTGFMSFHSTASCKVTEFMRHVVYLMSSWLVVCFTVDRFIAVCFPLLRVRYCTERCAVWTIVSLLLVIMLSQSYHLVFIERLDNNHLPCHATYERRVSYFGLNYFWFSFLLRFTLPFVAIAMCNGCIIYHIARMRKGRWAEETRRKQKASLAIYTLYAVCACFVITVLPNAIVAIVQFSSYLANERTVDFYCTLRTIYVPLHILRLVNYSANCVLYGIAGRQFRQELCKLLWCCIGRNSYDKRSIQSPEPIPLKADLLLTSRKHGNSVIRMK